MSDGQDNVNVVPGGDGGNGPSYNGPPWRNRPPWWEGVVTTLVWTVCTIIVIGFIIWGILFIFHDVIGALPH